MTGETNPDNALSYNREDNDNDAPVVNRVRNGDLDAFEVLVSRHQKRMLNIALRILGDYDEACECVQDVFVAAYRNIGSFRGDAKFRTWITAITLNHGRNRLKQLKSRSSRIAYSLDGAEDTEGNPGSQPPSQDISVLDRLEQQDISSKVRDCISALDLEYREVIILRDLQDYTYDEIGVSLGLRVGTVKSRLFRAREAVRECLKKAWGNL